MSWTDDRLAQAFSTLADQATSSTDLAEQSWRRYRTRRQRLLVSAGVLALSAAGAGIAIAATNATGSPPTHTSGQAAPPRPQASPSRALGFGTAPGCAAQAPYQVRPSPTPTRDGHPLVRARVGQATAITFGLDEYPTTPILSGELVVTKPGTTPVYGGRGGPGSFDDPTTHLVTVPYGPSHTDKPRTRTIVVRFTPASPGLYPLIDYQSSQCGGGMSVGDNIVAWIQAS
jgi:hypothetical protein